MSKKEGSTTTSYIRGADGQTIAVYENGAIDKWNLLSGGDVIGTVTSGGAKEYFLKDHLGSTRTVVNSSGAAVAYFDFYPYGKLMPGRYTTSNDDRYKFTGHERDEEAGLSLDYMMARNYDPEIGQFLQTDPLVDQFPGWSSYNYGMNNPLKYIDPTGMSAEEAENCPTCRQVLSRAFSWLEPVWNRKGQEIEHKSQQLKQEIKQEAAQATETIVKEGQEVLSDVSTASAILSVTAGGTAIATGVGPDDAILVPAARGLARISTVTDALATTLSVVEAVYFEGNPIEAKNNVIRTSVSIGIAGSAGGIVSNAAKPSNQEAIKAILNSMIGGVNK